ncbi:MAG: hypothetical protein HND53_06780 [Proteobacteria bacterium]|nr:hypothetical protein [Pseudomonadota bacterium]NOG60189.1 hypothetical protein [Pseudomonadota bacterium]
MNDTAPEIARQVHQRYMEMDGQQRLLIGMEMFETARKIAISSFPENITEDEKRRLLCERFYKGLSEKAFPKEK